MDEKLDPETESLLSALEAGELEGAARDEAEALLSRSATARATLERLARLRVATAALPDPLLPAAARRRIGEAAVAALDAGVRRRRARVVGSAAIALAAAAAAILLATSRRHRETPTGATADRRARRAHRAR